MKVQNKNGIIATLVVVGLGVAAYLLFFKKGGGGGGNGGGSGEYTQEDSKMLPIANALFDAMDGYGTGNTKIENQLKKLKSSNEWESLLRAYGTRTLNCGTGNPFCSDFTGTLPECLNDELDSDELERVNQILSKIGVSV